MAIQQPIKYELSFACTLAQFNTMCSTTLPTVGVVMNIPQRFQGIYKSNTAATGQCDFSYDGNAWLRFFYNNMTPAMITELTTTLAATLGAPVAHYYAQNPSYYMNV